MQQRLVQVVRVLHIGIRPEGVAVGAWGGGEGDTWRGVMFWVEAGRMMLLHCVCRRRKRHPSHLIRLEEAWRGGLGGIAF